MDLSQLRIDNLQRLYQDHLVGAASRVVGLVFATIYVVYQLATYFDVPLLAPQELLWNALIRIIPTRLLLDPAKRRELEANNMLSQTHAAKSEALRKAFGIGNATILQGLPNISGEGIMRRASLFAPKKATSDVPPGLGNWDNSCYQNSVLQGLAALNFLPGFLDSDNATTKGNDSTASSLSELVRKLQDPENNGRHIWTPAKLKNMSSWQQQDAQEYFSKVMDELDKEAAKEAAARKQTAGLKDAETQEQKDVETDEKQGLHESATRNPLEGLLAQRVACTRCGLSEGLSMIPFNCLTVPLGSASSYDVADCLTDYTDLEEISDVECAKCTLLKSQSHLEKMLGNAETSTKETSQPPAKPDQLSALPPELRVMIAKRLQAVETALENDDYADKTLSDACQISKKAHVSSTKTRQAVVGRAPRSLAIHFNRSVFDEMTGAQRKNYASVRYPAILDLRPWMLGAGQLQHESREAMEAWQTDAKTSMLSRVDLQTSDPAYRYSLKAVVTHYGRHENGHYICYRKHAVHSPPDGEAQTLEPEDDPVSSETSEKWWRLSDEDVTPVSEADVLDQGGVFMLFYERGPVAQPASMRDELANQNGITRLDSVEVPTSKMSVPVDEATDTSPMALREDVRLEQAFVATGSNYPTHGPQGQKSPDAQSSEPSATMGEEPKPDTQPTELPKPVQAPVMRTSHNGTRRKGKAKGRSDSSGFSGGFRPMAAT